MPYYVYALHSDSKCNDLCGSFVDYRAAEICERDKQRKNPPGVSFDVIMIYAPNQTHALQRVRQIRRERGLPTH
jgi:hypothetical protein